jgi:hypothetical protein
VNSAFEKPPNDLFKNKKEKHFLFHDDKLKELSPTVTTKFSSSNIKSSSDNIHNNNNKIHNNNSRLSTTGHVNRDKGVNINNSISKINQPQSLQQNHQEKHSRSSNNSSNNKKSMDVFATTLPEDEKIFNKYRYNFITGVHESKAQDY